MATLLLVVTTLCARKDETAEAKEKRLKKRADEWDAWINRKTKKYKSKFDEEER